MSLQGRLAGRSGWVSQALLLAAPLFFALAVSSQAQFAELTAEDTQKSDRITILKILKVGTLANQEVLDRYIKWHIAAMTQKKHFPELQALRANLRYRVLQPAGRADDPSVLRYLNGMILTDMRSLTSSDYHPYTRVNAALLIGELNEKEAPSSGRTPPVPWSSSLEAVLTLLIEVGQLEAVKAASLRGIDRHCRFGIRDEALKRQTLDVLFKLSQPVKDGSIADAWLRRRAMRALGHLGDPGKGSRVAAMMFEILNDRRESLATRCEAARAIGYLRIKDAAGLKVNFVAQAHALADLAAVSGRKTGPAKWLPEELQEYQRYLGFIELAFQGPDLKIQRVAVDGNFGEGRGLVAAIADPAQKAQVAAILGRLSPLTAKVFSLKFVHDDEIRGEVDVLEDWVAKNPPPKAKAAPKAGE